MGFHKFDGSHQARSAHLGVLGRSLSPTRTERFKAHVTADEQLDWSEVERPYFAHFNTIASSFYRRTMADMAAHYDAEMKRYSDELLHGTQRPQSPYVEEPITSVAPLVQAVGRPKRLKAVALKLRNVRPLRGEAPNPPARRYPPTAVLVQADRFDERRFALQNSARDQLHAVGSGMEYDPIEMRNFRTRLLQVQRHRYASPPPIPEPKIVPREPRKPKPKKEEPKPVEPPLPPPPPPPKPVWSLEVSIWWPRVAWCDSKSLYDSEECERLKFSAIVKRARAIGMQKFILRHDDGESDDEDGEKDASNVPGEVKEVEDMLWVLHDLVFMTFDYYASMDPSDLSSMDFNQYAKFITEFKLSSNKLAFAKRSHCDGIFLAVDTASKNFKGGDDEGPVDKHDRAKSLSIAEFIHVLVRLAVARYVESGDMKDVSAALQRMIREDIEPRVSTVSMPVADSNDFRVKHCYKEPVDIVLRRHEASLRAIFDALAYQTAGKIGSLLQFDKWCDLIKELNLLNTDVSGRDAAFCFTSARMCVANPYSVRGHMTSTGIPFEGFLEALVRLSCLKALPTDEEIAEAGQETAASFLSWLAQEDEMRLMKIIGERGTPFGAEPPQPPERCVDHLISIIVREILDEANATKKTLKVTIGEVRTWWRQHGGK